MIFFIILLSTISFSRSDELTNNFKINDKDIIKFTRDDAKDVIITRDENDKALSINPIIAQKRSEIVNATLNQLLLRSPVYDATSGAIEAPPVLATNDGEATRNVNPPNVIITKGIIKRAQDLEADQVPSPINSFATVIKKVESLDGQSTSPKVYFPPLPDNVQLKQQFKSSGASSDPAVDFTTTSEQDKLEESESIFTSQDKTNLSLQSLGLVGLLNLNNYLGIPSSSPSQEERDLAINEHKVSIPNVVLPLEPHNSDEPQSPSDGEFFLQPKDDDEQLDYDQPAISFELNQDYALEPKLPEDVEPETNVLTQEAIQPQFFGKENPTYENNQQGELNAVGSQQIQTEESNFKSDPTSQEGNFEFGSFLLPRYAVTPEAQQKELSSTLQQSSRSRAISNSQQNSLLHGQSSLPNDQLTQMSQKLTWQSVQTNKVNLIPNKNSNFHSGSYNSNSNLSPTINTNSSPDNGQQSDQSPVISLQPPGMLPYFSSLPNKSSMIPPNFNQPINILPEIIEFSFSRQPSPPVKWLQQSNQSVPHTAVGSQHFNILERPSKSDNYRTQQVFLADFLPETSASTNVPSTPNKSVYTLKEHRTIYDDTQAQQAQLTNNSPTFISKPADSESLLPNEQAILTFLKSQSELYDSQLQEQPIQFFPEPSTPENDQLTVQSVSQPSQPQNILAPSYQTISLEQPPIDKSTLEQLEGLTGYKETLIQPSEGSITTPKLDSIALETDSSEEIVLIPDPPKQDYRKPVEVPSVKTEACVTSTIFQDRFVTVTVISKILESVREPISTSYVTIRDHQTFTRTVKVPYVTNTVTEYIENSRCTTSQPSATRTYGRSLIANTEVPSFPPSTSSYTDYFGDGNSKETLKRTLDRYEHNYMDWVNKLKSRNFHIDKNGKPKNLRSLSYGEWPKHFVIDEQFWN